MTWLIFKYAVTAGLVVLVSEVAKRSGPAGGLLASLPIMTVLTLIWLHVEQQPTSTLADHAHYTFWYVIPTLPMFWFFPKLLTRWGFWPSLLLGALITLAGMLMLAWVLRHWGIELF